MQRNSFFIAPNVHRRKLLHTEAVADGILRRLLERTADAGRYLGAAVKQTTIR